ncbi:unnamed protein product [Diatraea saccharalis]|uniref:Glycogen debranching enzyme n=1 Tax=Diatraea saccharalis TaxID=40085 RepID=A0A9N9QXK5_9NEOP|nr:unnamed protein product [Diatraea saccharalis]
MSCSQRQMAIERCVAEGARPPATAAAPATLPEPEPQTSVITLEHTEHHDSTLYRLEKGCYLQFSPGPSLLGRKVFLYTNYVVTDGDESKNGEAEFVRNQYYGLEWRRGSGGSGDWGGAGEGAAGAAGDEALGCGVLVTDTDLYCELRLQRAGSFHYYFVYDSAQSCGRVSRRESSVGPQGSGWFQVSPTLRVGGGEVVPLDGVMCQTVLAKCLGPLSRWEATLQVAHDAGYNMIHFTPVQELGASNSSYSIANQLRLNPAFGADASFADVENLVTKMRTDWKCLLQLNLVRFAPR